MGYLAVILGSYLIGSSNMAYYLTRLTKKDITKKGSGNLGASNAVNLLGWKAGVLVGIHDIGKAVLVVLLAGWLFPELAYAAEAAGVACVLGHIFPFYLRFKGGKGFASFLGMLIALNWKLALVMLILVVVVTLITDYIVAATAVITITAPIAMGILTKSWIVAVILFIATAVILLKHRENYARIFKGTEIGLRSAIKGEHRMK